MKTKIYKDLNGVEIKAGDVIFNPFNEPEFLDVIEFNGKIYVGENDKDDWVELTDSFGTENFWEVQSARNA